MSKSNYRTIREAVRKIVSEHVYSILNEEVFEDKEDSEKDDDKDENHNDSETGQMSSIINDFVDDPKFKESQIAYEMFPDMDKDAARSYFSKLFGNNKHSRKPDNKEIIDAYELVKNELSESRMLTKGERKRLHAKMASKK